MVCCCSGLFNDVVLDEVENGWQRLWLMDSRPHWFIDDVVSGTQHGKALRIRSKGRRQGRSAVMVQQMKIVPMLFWLFRGCHCDSNNKILERRRCLLRESCSMYRLLPIKHFLIRTRYGSHDDVDVDTLFRLSRSNKPNEWCRYYHQLATELWLLHHG